MKNYPAFFSLENKRVVIAGGGELAIRKARLVFAAGADIVMIAPSIDEEIKKEFPQKVQFVERAPIPDDFQNTLIAIIAEAREDLQIRLHKMAKDAGALVNVVDAPDLCDFTTPSIIDRDDIVVAISTNGKAPVLGRNLREKIERMLPAKLGGLVAFAGSFRPAVVAKFGNKTRQFWEQFFDGPIANRFLAGDETGAHEAMMSAINHAPDHRELGNREQVNRKLGNQQTTQDPAQQHNIEQGVVHIIGAGPGDPELLTIRAHRLLQTADIILYDRLVGDQILTLARRDADRLYVGKEKSNHSVPQEEIHDKLIEFANQGKTVVRLKGGDPFIFGRGGEELDALRQAGIKAYITPGITAATGCAAASGMALTHRDHAQAVTFVTGHARDNNDPDLNWQALADLKHTLVVYMGVSKANSFVQNLIAHGRDETTPIAVIENGTRDNQIIVRGTLATLTQSIQQAGIKGPAILVIGDVAQLADEALITKTAAPTTAETTRASQTAITHPAMEQNERLTA